MWTLCKGSLLWAWIPLEGLALRIVEENSSWDNLAKLYVAYDPLLRFLKISYDVL